MIGTLLFALAIVTLTATATAEPTPQVLTLVVERPRPAPATSLTLRAAEATAGGRPLPEGRVIERRLDLPVDSPSRHRIALPDAPAWNLRLEGDGIWIPHVDGFAAAEGTVLAVEAAPAVPVTGRLRAPRGDALPAAFDVAVLVPADPSTAETPAAEARVPPVLGRSTCRVAHDGTLTGCQVPVGEHDLKLTAGEYTALYRRAQRIDADQPFDLGEVELRRGASLIARVLTPDGPPDADLCRVRLVPLGWSEAAAHDPGELTFSTRPDADGFVWLPGLPAGRYGVQVDHPGHVLLERHTVVVREPVEVVLDEPLLLGEAATLALLVVPATDPVEQPWSLTLTRLDGAGAATHHTERGHTDGAGEWRLPGLLPGPYRLAVETSYGSTFSVAESLELEPGLNPRWQELPVVRVLGTVRLDGAPLRARLTFGGRSAATKVGATSNEDGVFGTVLPQEGSWVIHVAADEPPLRLQVDERQVIADADGIARLDLDLEDGVVRAEVVDGRGEAAEGARVRLMGDGWSDELTSDADGRVAFHGLEEGEYRVEAKIGQRRSRWVSTDVRPGRDAPPVELVLHDSRTIAGRVIGPAGPVAGALVMAAPLGPGRDLMHLATSPEVTDARGAFTLRVSEPTRHVALRVMAVGHGFTSVTLPAAAEIDVPLEPAAGTLLLTDLPRAGDRSLPLVLIDGSPVQYSVLRRWAELQGTAGNDAGNGGGLRVPAMPFGTYHACRASMDEALLALSGLGVPQSCTRGQMVAGGTLTLDVP